MSRQYKVGTHKTRIYTENGYRKIKYHDTNVVSINIDKIILNTGGYKTVTTKTRMNQASNQFGLKYSVYQHKFKWYVEYNGKTIPFINDELILERANCETH